MSLSAVLHSLWDGAIVNIISSTCDFPAITYQNVCCEKVRESDSFGNS